MKLTKWKSGPPPMIGEWNASNGRAETARRWWNGKYWSVAYYDHDPEHIKRHFRRTRSASGLIEWRGLAKKPRGFVKPQPLEAL